MRKIKNIILILSSVILSSCGNYLDLNPNDQLSDAKFWKSEEDVKFALTGVYNQMLGNPVFNHAHNYWDGISDIAYAGGAKNITLGEIEPTTGSFITEIYTNCYKMIARCNDFLDHVDQVEMDSKVKNKYKGEVLFLRAMSYFYLTEFYGGVPYYSSVPTVEEAIVEQTHKEQVVENVLNDLNIAIDFLPNEVYKGHVVKAAALALKAQVLMHNEKFEEAATTAKQIIDSGLFSIYQGGYANLFFGDTQTDNPEIIFSVKYLSPNVLHVSKDLSPDAHLTVDLVTVPTQKLADYYLCIDGKSIYESELYDENDFYKNRDPRLSVLVRKECHVFDDGTIWDITHRLLVGTGYYTDKHADWSIGRPITTYGDQDNVLIRYATVLLMYAECQNEVNGPDQSVYDAINAIRTRKGVDMPEVPKGLSKEEMRQVIRDERVFELAFEGYRFLDLKRWKIAEDVLNGLDIPGGYKRKFDPNKHYLFPFPQSEIDRNPKLKQNPNY